ncbi:MAG: uracil-DNA glycosylase [Actinomycetes bacterium]
MDPAWAQALEPISPTLTAMDDFLGVEVAAGYQIVPSTDRVLAAFTRPMADVRVLIVGQDPYPTVGHAMGLAFSVQPDVQPIPRSLANIFRELRTDTGAPTPPTGDLRTWADRGVLLLNRVLTARAGQAGSHRGKGWESVTELAISALIQRDQPLVAVLWGRDAQSVIPLLGPVPHLSSPHPSPLSASRGFFGSRPFSAANHLLTTQGAAPIDWTLP